LQENCKKTKFLDKKMVAANLCLCYTDFIEKYRERSLL